MIRLAKARVVASFEFLSTVRRPGYLIMTFGMPLFVLLYGAIASLPGYFIAQKEAEEQARVQVFGLVDPAGTLTLTGEISAPTVQLPEEARRALEQVGSLDPTGRALAWRKTVFAPFAAEEEAREALLGDRIAGYYVLAEDFLESGEARYVRGEESLFGGADGTSALETVVRERLLQGHVPSEVVKRVQDPVTRTNRLTMGPDGSLRPYSKLGKVAGFVVPFLFMMMLFISLMTSAGYLLQGTATEKENRVVEVLLASANPDEILLGKLVGLGSAAILQVLVWFSFVIAAGVLFAGFLAAIGVKLPWLPVAVAIPYFIATYALLGSLMLGTGSLGNTARESQQWSMVWTMLTVLPMMFLGVILADPNGPFARGLTWFPFSSAITLLMRLTIEPEGVPWWEIAGALLLLVACTWLAIRFGARLFRVGLLLRGSRPKLREVLRQARLG